MSQRSKPRFGSEEHAAQNRPSKAEGYGASRPVVPGSQDQHRDSLEPSQDRTLPPRSTLTLPDKNALARQEAATLRAAEAAAKDEVVRQVGGAIGNTNQAQLDRRNAIADALDQTEDRAAMTDVPDEETFTPVESDDERAEREAAEQAAAAEAERARLEASDGEVPNGETDTVTDPDAAVVAPRKFKLKVNGKDVEFTEAELLERAQKVASADEYLQIAADAARKAQPSAPSEPSDTPSNVGDADIEDTLTSALMGDKEAIKTIARRLKAPPVVTPDVLSAVDDRMSFRSAVDWFRGEYKDLVEDPMLYKLVVDEDARIAQSDSKLSYRDRLKNAGDKIRAWKAGFVPPPAPTPPNPKLQRKASVAPVPQAGGRQTPPGEDEEDAESIESVIDKMAKARHQQGAIRPQKPTQ